VSYSFKTAHRDANQPAVVKALESAGALVIDLASVGKGVPDLLALHRGAWFAIEVKNPESKNGRHYTADGLTDAQLEMFARIGRAGGRVHVVTNAAEALAAIGAVDARDVTAVGGS